MAGLTNTSDEQQTFHRLMAQADELEARARELRERKKSLNRAIKQNKFSIKSFNACRALAAWNPAELTELRRQLAWLGHELGHQAELQLEPEAAPAGTGLAELTEIQQNLVRDQGRTAGMRGGPRTGGGWTPGSLAHALYDEGWMQGQTELAQRLAPEPLVRRGRGRPKGAKDKKPRARPNIADGGLDL